MSKVSILKDRARKEAERVGSRRQFIGNMLRVGVGLGLVAGGWKVYDTFRGVDFERAYAHPEFREKWLRTRTDSRPYVARHIATPTDLAELKRRLNYTPPEDARAATVIRDDNKAWNGGESDLFVYDYAFNSIPREHVRSAGRVVENIVNNHELVHADHWYSGIEGYPKEWFFGEDGKLGSNKERALLLEVSEAVAHRKEYDGLTRMKGKDDFVNAYQANLVSVAKPHFVLAYALAEGNKELRARIKREAWF
ncbi:MAG: hypothetical protein AABW80_03945 [Nanoarchaeota archaeon]